MITGHGGNIFALAEALGCAPGEIIDMSSNINPLGSMPELMMHLKEKLSVLEVLPEADAATLIRKFSAHYGIDPQRILAGSGTTQFIYMLPMALDARHALILGPTYADYADACRMHGVSCHWEITEDDSNFEPDLTGLARKIPGMDLVFICNANNPTGTLIPGSDLASLCRAHPETVFVIDESYLPFVSSADKESLLGCSHPNVVVLYSMSKIYKIPGLRMGFLMGPEKIVNRLRAYQLPWSVNALAQAAVSFLFDEKAASEAFVRKTRAYVTAEVKQFYETLQGAEALQVFPSTTTFILVKLPKHFPAPKICDIFSRRKILLRNCANFHGLSDRFIRISVKEPETNRLVAHKLLSICTGSALNK